MMAVQKEVSKCLSYVLVKILRRELQKFAVTGI